MNNQIKGTHSFDIGAKSKKQPKCTDVVRLLPFLAKIVATTFLRHIHDNQKTGELIQTLFDWNQRSHTPKAVL